MRQLFALFHSIILVSMYIILIHPTYNIYSIGAVYKATKNYTDGESVFKIIYEYKKKTLGEDDNETKTALKTYTDMVMQNSNK